MIAGLLYGDALHHLDHLGPICSLLGIPLVITEGKVLTLAKKFYPNLSLSYVNTSEASDFFLENFKAIISCLTRPYLDLIFFPNGNTFKEKIVTIWCPHGNSDKGLNSSYFKPLANETCILVYGKKMLDILKKKNVIQSNLKIIEVGNYRKIYYEIHYQAYQSLINEYLHPLKKSKKRYLYAPTWENNEKNSSILSYLKNIAKALKAHENLFIKLHPNTIEKNDLQLYKQILGLEKNPQIHFIEDFPAIYPLLDSIDAYIGDFSSIGYDVLAFKKPMGFLLPANKTIDDSPLFQCGINFSNFNYFEKVFEQVKHFALMKEKLYSYTFSNNPKWKEEIFKICK